MYIIVMIRIFNSKGNHGVEISFSSSAFVVTKHIQDFVEMIAELYSQKCNDAKV